MRYLGKGIRILRGIGFERGENGMNIRISIILFLAIMSLIPTLEYIVLRKNKIVYIYICYFAVNYSVLSVVKYYLGYSETSLFESFWDVQPITLIHYGIPMAVIAFAAPLLLKILFKKKDIEVLRYFLSSYFMAFSVCFLVASKVSNKVSCIAFAAALIITLCSIPLILKQKCQYIAKENLKERLNAIIPILLLYFVTVVIYAPSELYLTNSSDFPMPFWYYLSNLLLIGMAVCIILAIGIIFIMEKRHSEWFLVAIFSLVVIGYIQGLFLNGNMQVLDGTWENAYSSNVIILNMVVWGLIFVIIAIFFAVKKQTAKKIMKVLSIYIVLIQVVSLVVLMVSSEKSAFGNNDYVLTTEKELEVGSEQNIIVFVLDKFDGRYMDLVLEDEPDFLTPLNDFTYYKNAAGEFTGTFTGIPYLLTGTPFDEDSEDDYVTYAYNDRNLLTELNNMGYELGVYTSNQLVPESMKDIISK